MKDFLKSFFSFGFATSIEKLLSFILLPFYTRVFGSGNYGVIDLVQIFITFLSIFCLLQLETSLQRFYFIYSESKNRKAMITGIFVVVCSLSLLFSISCVLLSKFISVWLFNTDLYWIAIIIASIQMPFVNFSILSLIILRFEKENKKFLFSILIKVFVTLITTFCFVKLLKLGINGVFASIFFAALISFVYQFFITKKHFTIHLDREILKRCVGYALPQFPARLGSASISYANRFFMLAFISVSAIGVYSVSLKLASAVQLIYTAFAMAWNPFMFAQFERKNHKEVFAKVLDLLSVIVFPVIILLSLFSKEIIQIVSSKEFFEAKYYLGGLALYFSFYVFKEVVDIGPKKLENTKFLTLTFLISVVVNLITMYFFIKKWEVRGVVFSMILTNLVLFYVSWLISNMLYKIDYKIIRFTLLLFITLFVIGYFMYFDLAIIYKAIFALLLLLSSLFLAKKELSAFKHINI
ncbi:MAG: oligosaccharide flippase family protein [Sphingobacterium sp.]|jgi:O-antigen/teichoic acid export membrane protein|uniref:lipopolysaccharide biosynthesis protein n=1 Tax=Sphingobacterium sp. TaxID=341027 RepID=UPI002847056A|nr:oligosaccharide flippase family protein [Sphingobacterium sp.]MDR3011468.1 oligosaccharide flippase family protein [Sphingobacterium sp.]